MSYYGGTITVAGRNLITSLMAGETIRFTRIVVGSGAMPEGVEPIDMTELVTPVAEGTSTIPTVENGAMYMTVEYRNDLNGGLKEGFWLREFGIYAQTDKTEEILLYYATLGDSPQPVNAYKDNRIDIRRYPVTIALELDADIQVTYNPSAFLTSAEAYDIIDSMVSYAIENISATVMSRICIPAEGWILAEKDMSADSKTDEYPFYIDVPCDKAAEAFFPDFALNKGSIHIAEKSELCPTIMSLDGVLRFWAKRQPDKEMTGTVALIYSNDSDNTGGMRTTIISDFTIPAKGWINEDNTDETDDFPYYVDIPCKDVTEYHFPNVALDKTSLETASNVGLCPTVQSFNGKLRFWAKSKPSRDITGTAAFVYARGKTAYAVGVSGERVIPVASSTVIGGVRVCEGSGLTVGTNGELSIDGNSLADRISATDDEVQEVVNQYFDNN